MIPISSLADLPAAAGLLMVTALALAPVPGVAQQPDSIVVTGVVGDAETGRPIAGALVELPELDRRTLTDAHGRFIFLGLPSGPHRLKVGTLGYASWEEETAMEHLDMLRIGLLPQPIALENIRVTADRLERRRKATGVSVVAVDRDELLTTAAANVTEVLGLRSPYPQIPCGASSGLMPAGDLSGGPGDLQSFCIRWRGRVVAPEIFLDELPATFIELWSYQPAEIYAVEYYRGGREIRVYTNRFVEQGRPLRPRGF
jgi:hypothetical protein